MKNYPENEEIFQFLNDADLEAKIKHEMIKDDDRCNMVNKNKLDCHSWHVLVYSLIQLKVYEGLELIKQSGISYDFVVKIRMDIGLTQPFNFGPFFRLLNKGKFKLVAHGCGGSKTMYIDHILVGKLEDMLTAFHPSSHSILANNMNTSIIYEVLTLLINKTLIMFW